MKNIENYQRFTRLNRKNREYITPMKPAGQPVTLKWWLKGWWVIRKVVFLFRLFVIQKGKVSAET